MLEKYSSESPSRTHPMTWAFAYSSPAHVLATFFGSGVLHPAPGTWGTLAGLAAYLLLQGLVPQPAWFAVVLATVFAGAWASGATGRDIGVHDHGSIVIDEVAAVWMVLATVPAELPWQIAAFAAFRLFDIIKLPPAKWFDTAPRWQNGMGVMLDDIAAGAQAVILLQIVQLLLR